MSTAEISNLCNAQTDVKKRNINKEAKAIGSVEEAKAVLRSLIINLENCQTGSCSNAFRLGICDYVALLDIGMNGKIMDDWRTSEEPPFPLSGADQDLLKRIYHSCRMTHYQHWNYPLLTHVGFLPTPQERQEIYEKLEVPLPLEK